MLLFLTPAFAQDTEPLKDHQLKLNVLGPGFTYEKSIANSLSLNVDAMISFTSGSVTYTNGYYKHTERYFIGFPSGMLALQYYFNRARRESRGRSLYNNSGMYIAPAFSINGPDIINSNADFVEMLSGFQIGGLWGIQRTFNSNVNIVLAMGFGYGVVNGDGVESLDGFTLMGKLVLGFVLLSRPRKMRENPQPPKRIERENPDDVY